MNELLEKRCPKCGAGVARFLKIDRTPWDKDSWWWEVTLERAYATAGDIVIVFCDCGEVITNAAGSVLHTESGKGRGVRFVDGAALPRFQAQAWEAALLRVSAELGLPPGDFPAPGAVLNIVRENERAWGLVRELRARLAEVGAQREDVVAKSWEAGHAMGKSELESAPETGVPNQ